MTQSKSSLRDLAKLAASSHPVTRCPSGRRSLPLSKRQWFHLVRSEDPHGNYVYRPEYGFASLKV